MKRSLIAGLGLLILFATAETTPSNAVTQGRLDRDGRAIYGTTVKGGRLMRDGRYYPERLNVRRGKKGRKYARRFSLRANLRNDKLRIYDEYGHTPHRLGFKAAGKRTERWKYYSLGVEFVFDYDHNLIETRRFSPQPNHID